MNTKKSFTIIFANRKNCFERRGGDTIQMEKTKQFLEGMFNLKIKICLTPDEILSDNESDIVHIFNIQTSNETINFINAAKEKNKKIILSPIYWNLFDSTYIHYLSYFGLYSLQVPDIIKLLLIKLFNFLILSIPKFRKKYKNGIQKGLYSSAKNKSMGKYILNNVDLILPNSEEEKEELSTYFGLDISKKSITIPNATEFSCLLDDATCLQVKIPKDFVLQVGRIEPIKNQLNLVKALYYLPEIPILFVGKSVDDRYFNKLMSLAKKRGNIFFMDEISHEKMMQIYAKAKVHVLPSFRESPGLVSLEAKAMGTQIVVSGKKYCPIYYYKFDKIAEICDPYDVSSIKKTVLTAYNKEYNDKLPDNYKKFYSYENVAIMTYGAYERLFNEKDNGCINNISQL